MRTRVLLSCLLAASLPACFDEGAASAGALRAPEGLSASVLEGAEVLLAWTDRSAGESGFRIDVADTPIRADADVDEWAGVPANTSAYRYQAPPNAVRYFRVLAVTTSRQSPPSNEASAVTPDVPPAPGRFDALVGPDDSELHATLMWDPVPHASGYEIQRTTDGAAWSTLVDVGAQTAVFVDSTTSYDRSYGYRVRGRNANGIGVWSPVARASTRSARWHRLSSGPGDLSWNTSLTVAETGGVLISCYDASSADLRYAFTTSEDDAILSSPVLPGFPEALGYGSTSIAYADGLHLAASDAASGTLYHLTPDASNAWRAYAIDGARPEDKAILRRGPGDTLHVVYQRFNGTGTGLRYGARVGASWITEWIAAADEVDCFDFAVDGSGGLHVVFRRPGSGGHRLVYASKRSGAGWVSTTLPASEDPEMCSLALDAGGRVYVAYNSIPGGSLHVLHDAGGAWAEELVHRSPRGSWGRYNSIAVDPSGGLHVAYYDNLHGALRYAGRRKEGGWDLQLIDGAGDVGRFASLGVDVFGSLYVAYGDATNGAVKLAFNRPRSPGALIATPLDPGAIELTWTPSSNAARHELRRSSDGGVTWETLALNPGTSARLDKGLNGGVEYRYQVFAFNDAGSWAASNVASAIPLFRRDIGFGMSDDYGYYPSLDVSPDGAQHVSHLDLQNANVLYTRTSPVELARTITADGGPGPAAYLRCTAGALDWVGGETSHLIAQHLGDNPGGSVYDLRHTLVKNGLAGPAVVESAGLIGLVPCLKVGPDGVIHVVHIEQVPGGYVLRYSRKEGSAWTAAAISPAQLLYQNHSSWLALDAAGRPHVVYSRGVTLPGGGSFVEMVYGVRTEAGWQWTTLPSPPDLSGECSLIVDVAGAPHIVYTSTRGAVVHATLMGGVWSYDVAYGARVPAFQGPSVAVDAASGRLHVAFSTGVLLYARKDPGQAWVVRTLDASVRVGSHPSLALDATGAIHVAYRNDSLARLRLTSGRP